MVQDVSFEFQVLPFGLCTALRVFTKCMSLVVSFLRSRCCSIFPYLDAWLFTGLTIETGYQKSHTIKFCIEQEIPHGAGLARIRFVTGNQSITCREVLSSDKAGEDISSVILLMSSTSKTFCHQRPMCYGNGRFHIWAMNRWVAARSNKISS